ncbi:MAG: hypothetical protein BWY17_04957 [Deltaproteobacteria bacterium ADurb.Bin207]|nr:MAG: hypothetical protein BWY17_04957 [Deltaproteobacteria bacterium ADurb.Bin207]
MGITVFGQEFLAAGRQKVRVVRDRSVWRGSGGCHGALGEGRKDYIINKINQLHSLWNNGATFSAANAERGVGRFVQKKSGIHEKEFA